MSSAWRRVLRNNDIRPRTIHTCHIADNADDKHSGLTAGNIQLTLHHAQAHGLARVSSDYNARPANNNFATSLSVALPSS